MSSPFFKEDYIGFCRASDFSYIPSIREMELTCFTDNFGSCATFNNQLGTEQSRMDEFNILKSTKGIAYSRRVRSLFKNLIWRTRNEEPL